MEVEKKLKCISESPPSFTGPNFSGLEALWETLTIEKTIWSSSLLAN